MGYKSINVTKVFAIGQLQKSTEYIIDHLESWAKDRNVDTNMIVGLAPSSKIKPEPYGVTLVIGSWNYPMSTTVEPVVEAIAAGNCVCIKPSELAPKCSNLIKEIFEKYLDKEAY